MKRAFAKPLTIGLLVAGVSLVFGQNSELSNAKSFRIEETIGKSAHITVEVMKPDKIEVSLTNNKGVGGMLVCDDFGAHEYYSQNQYLEGIRVGTGRPLS
jgi:hypothetical protein